MSAVSLHRKTKFRVYLFMNAMKNTLNHMNENIMVKSKYYRDTWDNTLKLKKIKIEMIGNTGLN